MSDSPVWAAHCFISSLTSLPEVISHLSLKLSISIGRASSHLAHSVCPEPAPFLSHTAYDAGVYSPSHQVGKTLLPFPLRYISGYHHTCLVCLTLPCFVCPLICSVCTEVRSFHQLVRFSSRVSKETVHQRRCDWLPPSCVHLF